MNETKGVIDVEKPPSGTDGEPRVVAVVTVCGPLSALTPPPGWSVDIGKIARVQNEFRDCRGNNGGKTNACSMRQTKMKRFCDFKVVLVENP
jgi:hypothetical protein